MFDAKRRLAWVALCVLLGCSSGDDGDSGAQMGAQGAMGAGMPGAMMPPAGDGAMGMDTGAAMAGSEPAMQMPPGPGMDGLGMDGAGSAGDGDAAGAMNAGDGDGSQGDGDGEGSTPVACASEAEELFSFFMVSYEAIKRESGSDLGFGGDLGGIEGADDICRRVALTSSDCAGNRSWRAFLSTTQQDAIDRIGQGPWHDRLGRLLAGDIAELLNERPPNADPEIINDFPNEFGVPNRNPDGTGQVDNHQTLTGSGTDGRLYTQEATQGGGGPGFPGGGGFGGPTACMDGPWTPEKATCWDWTVSDPVGCPRVGHSWPRQGSGIHWISVWNEGGCAPGVVLDDFTPPGGPTVGSFGGYGGFYCFALSP